MSGCAVKHHGAARDLHPVTDGDAASPQGDEGKRGVTGGDMPAAGPAIRRETGLEERPASHDRHELFTDEQVAKLVQMSPRWVREQRSKGRLPYLRLTPGRHGEVRMRREDVEAWQRSMLVVGQGDE